MSTERQIAANRANAKRSTGPKTAVGKRRSSRNAYRHGLSGPLPSDELTILMIDAIARAVVGYADAKTVGADELHQATAFAQARMELKRIRVVRTDLFDALVPSDLDPRKLRKLRALDRYERLSQTKSRRATRLLSKLKLKAMADN
jgi:hypothetical protein